MKGALTTCVNFCKDSSKIVLREVYLNLCILLAVDLSYGSNLFTAEEFKQYSRDFHKHFMNLVEKDQDMENEVNQNELGDKEKDLLVAKVLEVIFEKKKNRIRVMEGDLVKLENDYFKLGDDDIFLKTSVLSYLIFMKMNTGNTLDMHPMTREIDTILANLKKSKLSKKLQELIQGNLIFNKTITLLLRGKFQDVKELETSTDIWENLSIKAYVYAKNKRLEAIENLSKEVDTSEPKNQFLISLLTIGAYHMLNNQKLYIDKFTEFMTVGLSLTAELDSAAAQVQLVHLRPRLIQRVLQRNGQVHLQEQQSAERDEVFAIRSHRVLRRRRCSADHRRELRQQARLQVIRRGLQTDTGA